MFASGALDHLGTILDEKRVTHDAYGVFFVDHFFTKNNPLQCFLSPKDKLFFVDSTHEPTTDLINEICSTLPKSPKPSYVVGMGGGCTLDTAKAVSNLITNGGKAEDYQGWDLVKHPGVYKIGIPTLSGTGAESSRTCVMMNYKKNLKLGMNSEHTIYDQIILDPNLSKTVPRDQYFYTGVDTYIHCLESLGGRYRNAIGDAYSREAITLAREVFLGPNDMMSNENREKMMIASYMGGCAIANSFVGVVHPFSAGLSVVLGTHHCLANCLAMNVMDEFYPAETKEFKSMIKKQNISLPSGICQNLSDEQHEKLYLSTVIHQKPLSNALGDQFLERLTREKVRSIFQRI